MLYYEGLDKCVESIINEAPQFKDIGGFERAQAEGDLSTLLEEEMDNKISELLTEEHNLQFAEVLKTGDDEQVMKFLYAHIPDLKLHMQDVMNDFKKFVLQQND